MGDFILQLFPSGGGLGQSVITTVWIGIAVVCLLNLRFGFPLTGLVVPGYLVPLLIVSPTSAAVILIEAVVVYGIMLFTAKYLMQKLGYAEMFGRDRFFAIILISILVRVIMDTLFWPLIANVLSGWDITFDYSSQLYSLGLVIIALTANVMWNGGFKYGMKVTLVQLLITFLLVRFVLMPMTNFSIANLAIMYEAVAASIIAAPKAYIILVITAFIASRANIKYGWEFNGIMLPALLALQLMQPTKLLTSFAETAIILIIGAALLNFTRLRNANIEGARLLLFFFNIGFIYKLFLNYFVVHYYPEIKVTDTFAFGYMLSTLLALKIYQKSALGLVIRATFQTSIVGGALAIVIGFIIMFIPSLFVTTDIKELQSTVKVSALGQQISEYKSYLYTKDKAQIDISSYQASQDKNNFKQAIYELNKAPNELENVQLNTQRLAKLDFQLQYDEHYIYIRDARKTSQRGLFIIARKPAAEFIVTVPFPTSESLASDSAGLIFAHFNSRALVFGTSSTPTAELTHNNEQSPYYLAFIEAMGGEQLFQIREVNNRTSRLLAKTSLGATSQYWIYNQLPSSLSQRLLQQLLGHQDTFFGQATSSSLPTPTFDGQLFEAFLNSDNYTTLLANVSRMQSNDEKNAVNESAQSLSEVVTLFSQHITAKGSGSYQPLTINQAALWEFEILHPLYRLKAMITEQTVDQDIINQLNQVNATAKLMGYELTLLTNAQGRFLLIAPTLNGPALEYGQGFYIISLNKSVQLNIEVPRPIFESNTLKFATELFINSNAEHLLIAGAHPYAHPKANVLSPNNVDSLFNVVHQSYLRFSQNQKIMNLQIRSHSAPSWIRPSALAFEFTQSNSEHQSLLQTLNNSLQNLAVDYQVVSGQTATRGLELGTSAQSGYQLFAPHSELATLWLASDFKQQFSVNQQSLVQRLLAISALPTIKMINITTLSPADWQDLSPQQRSHFTKAIDQYASSRRLTALAQLCKPFTGCKLQTIMFEGRQEYALAIRQHDKLLAIFNPITNRLTDQTRFNTMMIEGSYAIY
ncbi:poly-gamma-glutamate biosynthesis protein PgsC/CapC [Pseudoalteromonas haloplanktis]|uniref:Poly-gamma-glutamate biosynthesis protein PgsC/CapC n=1 Tax=Pseudoalteromonas haloplanktis TaxID=228 RepID=A0ABU1B9I8_PSEHA|nr:poly-gamma-glutamate biosynthesis protein PgsC/CapC [Pseudoalteromonas haloplanktis]MDQ9091188.1 poly-gamma-glutamate biosynthesis protein PgsC/CapC [Pseudoalteromonas haloplanktis]